MNGSGTIRQKICRRTDTSPNDFSPKWTLYIPEKSLSHCFSLLFKITGKRNLKSLTDPVHNKGKIVCNKNVYMNYPLESRLKRHSAECPFRRKVIRRSVHSATNLSAKCLRIFMNKNIKISHRIMLR
jgi:hypothetical protein